MKTRIYAVQVLAPHADGTLHEKVYLVDATSRQQAERHVGHKYVSGQIADGKTIARLMAGGIKLETAAKDEAESETATLPGVPASLDVTQEALPADKTFDEVAAERQAA